MRKNFKSVLIYTLLFFLISFIAFYGFVIEGKSLLLKMDAFNQHFVIFKNYHEIIRNGFSLFSWNISLGEGIIGQYAYYVIGDPFFYLSLPFSPNLLKYVYSILILVRIYCIGLSFFVFCKYKKEKNFVSIVGSLIYAFSSYSLLNSLMHPFFANAAILFPLLLIGVEKFLRENNCKYIIGLFLISIICNFYFCYILVVLSLLYAVIIYWSDLENRSIKDFILKLLKAGFCFIISVLLSCFLLLPILYAFLNSGRVVSNLSVAYDFSYFKSLLNNIFIIKEVSFSTSIGISSLLIVAFIFVFKKFRENRSLIIYFIILSLGLFIPLFGSIMNGLSYTSNRWTFAYCFILSYFVVRGLKNDLKYSITDIMSITFVLSFYIFIAFVFNFTNILLLMKSLLLVGIFIVIIFLHNYSFLKSRRIAYFLVGILLSLNLGYMGHNGYKYWRSECIRYDQFDYTYNSLNGDFVKFDEAINNLEEDSDFYRIGRYPRWFQNSSQYLDYMSSSSYLSISNKYLKQLSDELGNFDVEVSKPLLEFDNRTRITTLFGVKYFITHSNNFVKVPYEYYKYFSIDDLEIYKNKFYSLPVFYYTDVYSYDEWINENVLDREYLLTKVAVIEDDVFDNFNLESNKKYPSVVEEIDYEILEEYEDILNGKKVQVNKVNSSIKFNFECVEDKEVYLYIKNLNFISDNEDYSYQLKFRINGITNIRSVFDKYNSPYYYPMDDIYLNLGSVKGLNEIEWIFTKKGTYTFDDIKILAVDLEDYPRDIFELGEDVSLRKVKDNGIVVEVDSSKDGILQLSTGYSKGWKAFIDGDEEETFLVNRGFVGINLSSGKHVIEFRYETPYLKKGLLISLTTVIILFIYIKCRKESDRSEKD